MRTASLDFYAPDRAHPAVAAELEIDRADGGLDAIVEADATLERVAGGFVFTEGPVWSRDGALLFSSPNTNAIYRWHPSGRVTVFRSKSGYSGTDIGRFTQPGSNRLTFDPDGRLTICQHGNRRVIRVEPHGNLTVLADRFDGRRLNSPNDLVYRSDGTLFFTDPPFGLPDVFQDPGKELPFSGVFAVRDGRLTLVTDELEGPNGLAFSPDERYLYVGNWDLERKVVMRYELGPDCQATDATVLFDMTAAAGEDALDGLKVDIEGNVYACGPGGIWIVSPDGVHLGTLRLPEAPHNMLQPGMTLSDFELPDDEGVLHRLSELQGDDPMVLMLGRGEHCPRERQHQRQYTDPHHDATVPHTLVLAPGLVIDKAYVGYWFFGRPSAYQLWEDLQALFRRIKDDFDPTVAHVREAREASASVA
ncbi:MAG: SMP-30/gluconolactonase/LRE family protein [Solirubrobacteraceae bacterium]